MQGLPQAPKGPLVKLLVEDSIAPARHAFVWSSGAIKSINFDPHNQPINFSSPAFRMSEGRRDAGLPSTKGPTSYKGFHSPARHHSFGRVARS
jgi:hypothetical protein